MGKRDSDTTSALNMLQAHQVNDEPYQAFIHNSSEGIWRFAIEKPLPTSSSVTAQIAHMFKYAYLAEANAALAEMYGVDSVDKMIGARLGDFMQADDPENIAYLTAFIKSGYKLSGAESHEKDQDGNEKYFLNSLVGLAEDNKLVGAWGTQIDITTQKQALEALRQSEERLALALTASGMGIWEWDIQKNELTWSKELKELFGLKPTDTITYEKYLSLLHPEDIAPMQEVIQQSMRTGNTYKVEHRNVWADGSVHWVLGHGQAFLKNGKAVRMVGTSMNIDERKIAEIRKQASEERLALALKASKMGFWEWNLETDELMWSKELRQLFGLDQKEKITHKKYLKLLHPDDRDHVAQVIEEALRTGEPYTVEDRVVWPDGSIHWLQRHGQAFLKNGKAVRMVGTSMNIDERKAFEIGLHESEERFRNMADAAPVLIWVAGIDKMLTYFNKGWQDFTGRSSEEDLGTGWEQVIHPDDLAMIKKVYATAFDNHEIYHAEYRIRRKDNKYIWMLDKGAPRYSPEGEFLGYVGSMIEVEEIKSTKKRQKELEEINQKLIELNNSKDEFISLASHQLRTPATGVKQYIGMVLEGYGGNLEGAQRKMLHTAYESNERGLRIIDDLLKIAHVDAGKVTLMKTKTDLVDLLEDVIDEQADKFKERNQGIAFKHSSRQVTAVIDPERMRMVLENLIDNASKYSPKGKSVSVDLRQTSRQITIRISDQGVGIAKRDLPRLFRKFSRVDNPLSTLVGGTGLGLYWVKKIITLHGGTIVAESRLHKGSTFIITIPKDLSKIEPVDHRSA